MVILPGEPVLVEVGARCHGAEGLWVPVEDKVYRYNQVDLTCAAYLNPPIWEQLPYVPSTRHGYGTILFIVSYQSGVIDYIVKEILDEIRSFSSYEGLELFVKDGTHVSQTDFFFVFLHMLSLYLGILSYFSRVFKIYVGSEIKPTTDCFSWLGNLQLCHEEKEVVDRDTARLREIEAQGLLYVLK